MDTQRKQLLEDSPPPPVHSGPRKPLVILTCGGVIAALLLLVVLNIEPEPSREHVGPAGDDVIELIAPPGGLTDADLALDELSRSPGLGPLRAERGWIETRKRDGSPAQRYRTDSLNPAPEGLGHGWIEMTRPQMELFSDKRLVTIAGDTALAFAPQRAVEHGRIRGDVVVKVFDFADGESGRGAVELDQPSMVMRTDEASFDNFLGEIRADGWVRIESATFELPGRRLSVLIDDHNDAVRISLAEVDYIRFTSAPRDPSHANARTQAPSATISARAPGDDATADEARFYALTIRDNVRIDEGDAKSRRIARGERLEVLFSSRSRGLVSPLAFAPGSGLRETAHATPAPKPSQPIALQAAIASLAFAAAPVTPQPIESSRFDGFVRAGDTFVRCDGPLTIEPLSDQRRALRSPEDARLELSSDTRDVLLCDFGAQSQVTAQSLVYYTRGKQIELIGSPDRPIRVSTPEMEAVGERLRLAQRDGEGAFNGAGWMGRRDRDQDEWLALVCMADDPQPQRHIPSRVRPPEPLEVPELKITWSEGVDLQFHEGGSGRLRSAIFKGDVKVVSTEFTTDAEQIAVRFPADPDAPGDAIEAIHATGGVAVVGAIEDASIHCEDLHLDLAQATTGKTIPKLLVATGEVQAVEREQVIWADLLRVSFREATQSPSDDSAEAEGRRDGRRGAEVETLLAERDVQVVLADGTRVFADRLVGDGVRETVDLTGESVMIVSDRMIVDQGTHITLNRKEGLGQMPGPGVFQQFQNTIELQPSSQEVRRDSGFDRAAAPRTQRPLIDPEENPLEVRATWQRSLLFDGTSNDGAGMIDLRGNVSVVSDPSPLEHNTMTGEALTLDYAFVERPGARERERTAGSDSRSRELVVLTARESAKIESRTWMEDSRDDEPRIFYVAGNHVEYHSLTGEALVVGDGELLMHDVTVHESRASGGPFGARGSTMATWEGRLQLTRRFDDVFNLVATRNVRLRHRDPHDAISTLMCNELTAVVHRRERIVEGETPRAEQSAFDFGGSATLERVTGSGAVEIRTVQRTVHCDEFDYNVGDGIALLRALPDTGREVTIATAGSPFPMHAQEALWNMQRDTISITRGRGGLGR